jgi:hypothetical protein
MRLQTTPILACLGLAALGLASCQTAPPRPAAEPLIWGRADCQRAAGRPDLVRDFEQAKLVCAVGAEPYQAGSISCMASRGYLYRTRGAHDRACMR